MNIANAIKKYRLSQGLTQEDLAAKINKTKRTIQRYESGQIMPNMNVIDQIFNINIEHIISNEILAERGV